MGCRAVVPQKAEQAVLTQSWKGIAQYMLTWYVCTVCIYVCRWISFLPSMSIISDYHSPLGVTFGPRPYPVLFLDG